MRKILAVDVDNCVVRSDLAHWSWLNKKAELQRSFPNSKSLPYDLGELFQPELKDRGIDSMDFWRGRDIYDHLSPIDGCVEALTEAKQLDYEVVFVSVAKGFHHKSKYLFLKRHFPFMDGCIFTKEKHYVKCDMLIDDRHVHLNSMPKEVWRVKYETPFTQGEGKNGHYLSMSSWSELSYILEECWS